MGLKKNSLPSAVAEKYNCSITPGVVIISKPVEVAGRWDLTQLSLDDAAKLAKAKKYLTEKGKPAPAEKK